ncbi:COPII coat assembly protein sec-16 [Ceratocystis platani]|uniref:Protein transport protein sec16 n=1 Tax=Ceratocystis fimbriata f. sp. platani TaxID=88771 RepID=A0A0F8B0W0_CERFI|nr:COPII coat assembly protein sec-16 [Ceratocystis platani]
MSSSWHPAFMPSAAHAGTSTPEAASAENPGTSVSGTAALQEPAEILAAPLELSTALAGFDQQESQQSPSQAVLASESASTPTSTTADTQPNTAPESTTTPIAASAKYDCNGDSDAEAAAEARDSVDPTDPSPVISPHFVEPKAGHWSSMSFARTAQEVNFDDDDGGEWGLQRTATDPFRFMAPNERSNSFPVVPPSAHHSRQASEVHPMPDAATAALASVPAGADDGHFDTPHGAHNALTQHPFDGADGDDDGENAWDLKPVDEDILGGAVADGYHDDGFGAGSRFEEGVPLIAQAEQEISPAVADNGSAFVADEPDADDDDFFSRAAAVTSTIEASSTENGGENITSPVSHPPTLERKSTIQAMGSLNMPQETAVTTPLESMAEESGSSPGIQSEGARNTPEMQSEKTEIVPQTQTVIENTSGPEKAFADDSDAAADESGFFDEISQHAAATPAADPAPSLEAKWDQAFADDDDDAGFLDGPGPEVDVDGFLSSDDGSLLEDDDDNVDALAAQTAALNIDVPASSAQAILPANSNSYLPSTAGPYQNLDSAAGIASNPYAPVAASPATAASAYNAMPPPARPELQKVASFADRSKSGYTSPYDLPIDVKPHIRPLLQLLFRLLVNTQPPPLLAPVHLQYLSVAISGFCFGNTSISALPVYSPAGSEPRAASSFSSVDAFASKTPIHAHYRCPWPELYAYTHWHDSGVSAPTVFRTAGEISVHHIKDMVPLDERLVHFPGPLKGKGKKKEVVAWLSSGIEALERELPDLQFAGTLSLEQNRAVERILLWKLLRIMVENDGAVDGSETVVKAVRELLTPGLDKSVANDSGDSDYLMNPIQGISSGHITGKSSGVAAEAVDSTVIDQIKRFLALGDGEKAAWAAADKRLWGHAMLIANSVSTDLYKQVAQEFVRKEVNYANHKNESLAALYKVLSGNPEECVDELVSSHARAGLQLVAAAPAAASGLSGDSLEGLDKWRETVSLILSNRSSGDLQALVALGDLLLGYGRPEASHVCFLFAKSAAVFSGLDDPRANFVLVGADHRGQADQFAKEIEPLLLSDVFEYALSLAPVGTSAAAYVGAPHLTAYRLHLAMALAEYGHRDKALQYCEAIITAMNAQTRRSPYHHPILEITVDDLLKRLRSAPKEETNSWLPKPSINKVSDSMWNRFNKFVAGDGEDGAADASGSEAGGGDIGPFARIAGGTPTISRSPSVANFSDAYPTGMPNLAGPLHAAFPAGMASPPSALSIPPGGRATSRYAPSPMLSSSVPAVNPYAPALPATYKLFWRRSFGAAYTSCGWTVVTIAEVADKLLSCSGPEPDIPICTYAARRAPATDTGASILVYSRCFSCRNFLASIPKKKSFMDDDDDDIPALKRPQATEKSERDRENEEMFRRIAEEEAKKAEEEKAAKAKKGWGFGGWFGGKKETASPQATSSASAAAAAFFGLYPGYRRYTTFGPRYSATPRPHRQRPTTHGWYTWISQHDGP